MKCISPCNEKFSSMTKQGNGRFCHACEKVVVDFSRMSTGEIKNYFERNAGREICGYSKSGQTGDGNAFENFLFRIKDLVSTKIQFVPARLALTGIISGLVIFTSSCIGKRASDIHAYNDAKAVSENQKDTAKVNHPEKK
jgi:hypothetical protein